MNLLALMTVISSLLAVALLLVLEMHRKARATLRARDRSLDVFQQRLSREMTKREAAEHALANTDTRDPDTGAASHARFLASGEEELRRASRYGRALAVLLVSPLDDGRLSDLAAVIDEGLRDSDLLGRLDGDRLAILLPETDLQTAREVGKRLSDPVASVAAGSDDAGQDDTKVERVRPGSVGCAGLEPSDESFDAMLARAGRELDDGR